MRKKILISAYAISPEKGSEYGAAWNSVINLAQRHELWVLYGMSDDHMGDTQTMRQYLSKNTLPNVHFIEVRPGFKANSINSLNKIGMGWFFYFAYYLWQKNALKAAQNLFKTVDIDVVHQLGPIGFREPGMLWKLNKPTVWGPIGGMMKIDERLLVKMPVLTRLKFAAKSVINYIQLNYSRRVREAFKHVDVLIAATSAGQQTIKNQFGRNSYYFTEQGVINAITLDQCKFTNISKQVQLVWSGTHIDRKNLTMCLEALGKVTSRKWLLHVLGCGTLTKKLKQKAGELQIADNIIWHGQLKRTEAIRVMAGAHLHIMTSIAEDNPAVIFEALSYGVPTLTIDHCGMGNVLCNRCGIKIPIDNYAVMVNKFKAALEHLILNTCILEEMAQTTMKCAANHRWDKRLDLLDSLYNEAIIKHSGKKFTNPAKETLVA